MKRETRSGVLLLDLSRIYLLKSSGGSQGCGTKHIDLRKVNLKSWGYSIGHQSNLYTSCGLHPVGCPKNTSLAN